MFLLCLYSKTVTWADDIDDNYEKYETTPQIEKQDNEILEDTESFYNKDDQQFQTEYSASEYSNVDNGIGVGIESNSTHNQYDDNQYQMQTIDQSNPDMYNAEYYYPDQELNQYEQQYEPQQTAEVNSLFYFALHCIWATHAMVTDGA